MVNNCSQSGKKGKNIPSNTNGESQPAVEKTSYSPQNLSEKVNDSIPAPSVFDDEPSTRYDPPHAATRPWIKQMSISKSLPLCDHQKATESLVTGLKPPDTVKAWLRQTMLPKDWSVNTHLCEIIEGVYAESPTESPNIDLNVVDCNWRELRDGRKIKIRWLLKPVTLGVLLDANEQLPDNSTSVVHTGTVIKHVGYIIDKPIRFVNTTEPVIFLSTPSLTVPEKAAKDRQTLETSFRTLLQFLYGSGFSIDSDRNVGVPALQRPQSDLVNALKVPETGFLLIGSETLINFSTESWKNLVSSNIRFRWHIQSTEDTENDHYEVKVLKNTQTLESTITIGKTCDYETFMKKAEEALDIGVGLEMYVLIKEHKVPIDEETWTEYTRSGEVGRHVFHFDDSLRSLWEQGIRQPDDALQVKQQANVLPLIPGKDISDSMSETSQEPPSSGDLTSPSKPLVELTGIDDYEGPGNPSSASSTFSSPGTLSEGSFVPFLFWKSPKINPQMRSSQEMTEGIYLLDRLRSMQFEEPIGRLESVAQCTRRDFELKCKIAKDNLEKTTSATASDTAHHEDPQTCNTQRDYSQYSSDTQILEQLLQVSNHFRGTLDALVRQVSLASVPVYEFENPRWLSISPFLSIAAPDHKFSFRWKKLLPEGCSDCGRVYQRVEQDEIIYDPCLGWLQWGVSEPQLDESYTSIVRQLSEDLLDIWTMAHEIHTLALGKNLFLLQSLMDTFEHIVIKIALAAEELAQMNQVRLRLPETSVVMADIGHDGRDRLNISTINPEVLVTILLNNLHRDTIVQGTRKKLDIVKHYQRVSNALRSAAIRNPARKRFLEISRLEEELEALQAVLQVQECTLERYKVAINPVGLKSDPTSLAYLQDRKDIYHLEERYLNSQIKRLADDRETLEMLRNVANKARKDMRQVLEVLDEGHGKAIRVFTFVTLFFLPLSFVTSFFGMNTTDVRDIEWNQKIFWSSAIPLTLAVLSIALLYGYKWDLISSRVRNACRSRQEPGLHAICQEDLES
ncbi:uncharacterized protein FIESC28_09574 [Fusarium coffeatum]|uniref:Uncharacterized protein n=1 Tax=Fusarium coffeatum TaxID=231269 RepID=A0A366R0Z9_9HYPO|nr:uncharacterized protein FIESC28_09574 [Fusarium coffeatum]RBR10188.1 hypothetical protein FIESC28_09574 [Fusarium coffeatum]